RCRWSARGIRALAVVCLQSADRVLARDDPWRARGGDARDLREGGSETTTGGDSGVSGAGGTARERWDAAETILGVSRRAADLHARKFHRRFLAAARESAWRAGGARPDP